MKTEWFIQGNVWLLSYKNKGVHIFAGFCIGMRQLKIKDNYIYNLTWKYTFLM